MHDKNILVTRPALQAEGLCALLEAEGANPIRFPTLEILPPRDPQAAARVIDQLARFDLAIFISANAVEHALPLIQQLITPRLKLAVVGQASARALAGFGYAPHIVPASDFSSEGLLAVPALQALQGKRIVIFRGEGGRELLAEALRARDADVVYAEVYRRSVPALDPAPLIARWHRGDIDAVTVTSNEALQNLFAMIGADGQQWLRTTPLVVVSARARALAQTLGVRAPVAEAEAASDVAIVATLRKLLG
ncbi:MAG: uroporphyrinogen-III synthase [Gammaproteobacteria bacterium]